MKLGLLRYAPVCALAMIACGSAAEPIARCDGDDMSCALAEAGVTGSADAGSLSDAIQNSTDASASKGSDGGAGGSGNGGTGGGTIDGGSGTGVCGPGLSCGGLWECSDTCFSERCCVLYCQCTDPSGQSGSLECQLHC